MRTLLAWMACVVVVSCGGASPSNGLYESSGGSGGTGSGGSGGSGGGTGGPCSAEQPCTEGYCDSVSSLCVECLFSSQCDAGQICKDQRCIEQPDCSTSLDCADNDAGLQICDVVSHVCVECTAAADCGAAGECVNQRCVSHTACSDSRDCEVGDVCDPAKGWCVACVGDADCPADNSCIASECKPNCVSDNQCTPQNQLCDKALGVCVDCLTHDQCPAEFHCSAGKCEFDVCSAGATSCSGNAILTCNEVGDGFSTPTACGPAETCTSSDGSATCAGWACEAGQTYCEPGTQTALECSTDGLTVLERTDCSASGQQCFNGECRDQLCTPSSRFCDGNAVKQCDATGQSATLVQQCGASQYCDGGSPACLDQICTPNAATCDGNVATTCDAQGSGYVAGGTDCTSLGKTCDAGVCSTCPSPAALSDSLRIVEVNYGAPDYVVLKNQHPTCAASTAGLGLRFSHIETVCSLGCSEVVRHLNQPLPVQQVPAHGVLYVTETPVSSNDVQLADNLGWQDDERGAVRLCQGVCDPDDTSNTVDFVSILGGASSPLTASPPITFSNPISGIGNLNQLTTSYVRSAFDGSFPSFLGSDWTIGPATRPGM
ncbi:MAG: hypothetical protein KC766_21560 [Myxococcales bacterium]|nr:hypothetical protein [Myxococcales bacterium]